MKGLMVLALFIGVPLVEIALFVQIGGRIGIVWTIVIVIATAMAGTALLRMQGLAVMRQAQETMTAGGVPVESLIDGLFLLIAGILLLTPGFLTDFIGFLFFVPPVRRSLGRFIWAQIAKSGSVEFGYMGGSGRTSGRGPAGRAPGRDSLIIEGEVIQETPSTPDTTETDEKGGIDDASPSGENDTDSPWRQ